MRKLVIGAVAFAVVAAVGVATGSTPSGGPPAPPAQKAGRLSSFGSCSALLRHARRNALSLVGPYGLSGGIELAVPAEDAAEAAPAPSEPGLDSSATNVQEEGVDEPDLVKSDGRVLYALAQGRLHAVDVGGPLPRLLGSLDLAGVFGQQLLLYGDRLLVIAHSGVVYAEPLPAVAESILPGPTSTQLLEVDVSDPSGMRIARTLTVDASYVGARLVGSSARVVLSSLPGGLEFVYPESNEPADLAEAEHRNRSVIARSTVRNWVPSYRLEDRATGAAREGRLVRCRAVRRPAEFSGLGLLTVLTLDLGRGIEPVDSDAVMTTGETVYASKDSLYVATQRWQDAVPLQSAEPPAVTTAIHKFDTASPGATTYRASGTVKGYLLSQWSLSEHDGYLRVATTDLSPWWGDAATESESAVTVLAERAGGLEAVGRIEGLGRGERIYAVRFIGELGYVVTFRQVDPLHVLDLSEPERPVLRGELELPGYSAYLHPVGEGLLLGVGQDATPEGRVLGTQVSLFDVSDPAAPVRVDRLAFDQGFSEAELDHHAFLWWAPAGLAVLPVESRTVDALGYETWSARAVALRVRPAGIQEAGAIAHEATPIRRAIVVGDALYTVSEAGVKASDLLTLADRAWVPFS